MNDHESKKFAAAPLIEAQHGPTEAVQAEELKGAVEQVIEYLKEERSHYEACREQGESGDGHIYLATLVLQSWLEGQHQQPRQDVATRERKSAPDGHALGDAHDLLPDALAETVPPLRATENDPDPVIQVKLFTPDSSWTWYVVEFDRKERLCYGLVDGLESEFGYFSLDELEEVRGPMGLSIERDLYFEPTPVSEIQQELGRAR